jgi:hypothetical protein
VGEEVNGFCHVIPNQNIPELAGKNSLNEGLTDKIKDTLKNGLLNLIIDLDDKEFDPCWKKNDSSSFRLSKTVLAFGFS